MANTNMTPQQAAALQAAQQAGMMGELQSEVSAEAAPLLQFITRHVSKIVGVVLVLIVAIVATGIYQWQSDKAMHEAQLALGKALTTPDGEARIKALEDLLGSAPESLREGVQLEVALAAMEAEQFEKAAAAFGAVAKADMGPMGTAAGMNQASALLRAEKAAEAVAVLEDLERTAPEAMRASLLTSLAVAAEAAGNTERAVKAYESLIALGDSNANEYFEARIRSLNAPQNAGADASTPTQPTEQPAG